MNSKTRSLKQLLTILNPGRKKRRSWHYIGVLDDPFNDLELATVGVHEIHYNRRGGFMGITGKPVTINGANQKELFKWLGIARRDIKKYPVLTTKEFNLIFYGRQSGPKAK